MTWKLCICICLAALRHVASASQDNNAQPDQQRKHHVAPLASLITNLDNSWLAQLSNETESNRLKSRQIAGSSDDGTSNNVMRPVFNGHYVSPVKTALLANPRLVIHSPEVATMLGLSDVDINSKEFVSFVSGDIEASGINETATWATPYALSIMGKRYKNQCPYRSGVGYGDGRAVSIGEFLLPKNTAENTYLQLSDLPDRYELQLKGAGPTPFCRRADGRAVLRSSIREFLASEAMHFLGVPTTRALSLVVSDNSDGTGCTVRRPWYSDSYRMSGNQKGDPDVMIKEPCAITCRASPSYVRVGHLDLYARRVTRNADGSYDTSTLAWGELEDMIWHGAYRDLKAQCYDGFRDNGDVSGAAKCISQLSMEALSTMVAHWIRVGFAQGNFNADNCLISGRTVDYGPFGYMDEYSPTFAKWTGSGYHFGFMNQAEAGYANYIVLLESLMPVIEAYDGPGAAEEHFESMQEEAEDIFQEKVRQVFRVKMGFHPNEEASADVADMLWTDLENILRDTRADWTLFWRQLYEIVKQFPVWKDQPSQDYEEMLNKFVGSDEKKPGSSPFYAPLSERKMQLLQSWISDWRHAQAELFASGSGCVGENSSSDTCVAPEERMRTANPKYVLREWMLVEAYTKASPSSYPSSSLFSTKDDEPDESVIHDLYSLIQNPYDEGSPEQEHKYYRRAPEESLQAGGTAYMS